MKCTRQHYYYKTIAITQLLHNHNHLCLIKQPVKAQKCTHYNVIIIIIIVKYTIIPIQYEHAPLRVRCVYINKNNVKRMIDNEYKSENKN